MKRLVPALALAALCSPAHAGPETWSSLKATGGLSVGPAFSSTDGWLLVVRANLTHLRTFLDTKTGERYAVACSRTEAVVEGRDIYLTAISGAPGPRAAAICPAAKLGRIEPGTYKVWYRGPGEKPVLLKEIELER